MPGKVVRKNVGGKNILVYRRADGALKIGKYRYARYSQKRDRSIAAKTKFHGKKSRPTGYPHVGDWFGTLT